MTDPYYSDDHVTLCGLIGHGERTSSRCGVLAPDQEIHRGPPIIGRPPHARQRQLLTVLPHSDLRERAPPVQDAVPVRHRRRRGPLR